MPLLATEIPHPHSSPVSLGTKPDDAQCASAKSSKLTPAFSGPMLLDGTPADPSMQGGLDVRTADAQSCASTVHTSVTLDPGA